MIVIRKLTVTGPQSCDITHRSKLHRVTELSVLEEDIVEPVGVGDPLQGVHHHHKDSLREHSVQFIVESIKYKSETFTINYQLSSFSICTIILL